MISGELVAKQTLVKYTPTHAYCVYSDCSDEVAGKDIRVKEDEVTHHLKLVSIEVSALQGDPLRFACFFAIPTVSTLFATELLPI